MSTEMRPDMFDRFIGQGFGHRTMPYTWRDIALYAISVGAEKNDLPYIFEKSPDFKTLPTFGLVPYLNTILVQPTTHATCAPNEIVRDHVIKLLDGKVPNCLHMGMEMEVHSPIDPFGGTLLMHDELEQVYDRGEGKGIVAGVRMDIYNAAGLPVCTLKSNHYIGAFGGFGGPRFDSGSQKYPDRAPDYEVTEYLHDNQAVLYRLMGDTNDVHIDPEVSGRFGYSMPFMQGLGTYGFAVRMGIQAIIPYQPERVTRLKAQMRAVTNPGQNVTFRGWTVEPGKVYFKLVNAEGKALLDNGCIEYR